MVYCSCEYLSGVWYQKPYEYRQQLSSCKHAFLPPSILGIITLGTVQCKLYAWNSLSTPKLDHLVILVLRTHDLCQNFYPPGLLTFLCIVGVHNLQHLTSFTVYPLTVRHCYDDCHHRILVSELDRVYVQFYLIIPSRLMFTPLVEPDQIPEIVGCVPQCTEPLCRWLLTAFWIPFFVCETRASLLCPWSVFNVVLILAKSVILFSLLISFFAPASALSSAQHVSRYWPDLRLVSGLKYRSKLSVVVFRDGMLFWWPPTSYFLGS